MGTNEKELLLQKLIEAKRKAFEGNTPSVIEITAVKDELLTLPAESKPYFKKFVEELKNDVFDQGITLGGLDLNLFDELHEPNSGVDKATALEVESEPAMVSTESPRVTYKSFFLSIISCLEYELRTLKGYFFIHLEIDTSFEYKPVILHDNRCYYEPSQKKLTKAFETTMCLSIEDFRKELESGKLQEHNYIVLIILSTKINDPEAIEANKKDLKSIMESFSEFNYLSLKNFKSPSFTDIIVTNDQDAFMDEIEYVTSTILTNAELSNDEEKLIKKLFASASNTLEYKVLKGGKSGSKVLEVRPRMAFSNEFAKRFVVKFGKLDGKNKIHTESKAFTVSIENFKTENYHATKYEKNATVEGMKYTYASKDAVTKSYSYASILSDKNNRFYADRKKIIDELFEREPFDLWNSSKEENTFKVADLYSNYIKKPGLYEWIRTIKGLDEDKVALDQLVIDFDKIFDYELKTNKKICHGDLHSENFFKDDNGIYLIDFGFTALNHALVDHTALECSIKFKHIPRYIEIKVLLEIEEQLLTEESFSAVFEVATPRNEILDYFNLINTIRLNAIQHSFDKNSRLEYLISLFIMTCRQIQYDDLNQLYALKSAEKIGERIIQLIT